MRTLAPLLLSIGLSLATTAQAPRDVFTLKGKPGLSEKSDAIIQLAPVGRSNTLLLVGKNDLQFWDAADGTLLASSPHKIRGYWTGGLLMKLASFPRTAGFPLALNTARMKISPDGSLGIMIDQDRSKEKTRTAFVWDLKNGNGLGTLTRPGSLPVREIEFTDDGSTIMSIHGDLKNSELMFWDAKTLAHRLTLPIRDLSFHHLSRDGSQLITSSGEANKWLDHLVTGFDPSNGLDVWKTGNGKLIKKLTDGDSKFVDVTFVSPDDRYAVSRVKGGKIVVWDLSGDGLPKYRIDQAEARLNHGLLGISDDSAFLLTRTKQEALVYELSSGKLFRRFPIREEYSYTLSPDSNYAVLRSDSWVGLFDLVKGDMASHYNLKTEMHQRENEPSEERVVERATLSPDSKLMMIAGQGSIRIHDVATGALLQTLFDPEMAKFDDKGKVKKGGLDGAGLAGWLPSGGIYVTARDGRSFYLWTRN